MPDISCLDERTKAILERITEMDERLTGTFGKQFDAIDARLKELDLEVQKLKLQFAVEDGRKSVTMWVGGMVLAMLGAVANMLLLWLLGPNGPLHSPK